MNAAVCHPASIAITCLSITGRIDDVAPAFSILSTAFVAQAGTVYLGRFSYAIPRRSPSKALNRRFLPATRRCVRTCCTSTLWPCCRKPRNAHAIVHAGRISRVVEARRSVSYAADDPIPLPFMAPVKRSSKPMKHKMLRRAHLGSIGGCPSWASLSPFNESAQIVGRLRLKYLLRATCMAFLNAIPDLPLIHARSSRRHLENGRQEFLVLSDDQRRVGTAVINQDRIHASYFFDFYDDDFLAEVYAKLLGRAPDPTGIAAFLPLIRAGESRYRVLDNIASSSEAREFGVQLLGMELYHRMLFWRNLPVVGRLVDAAVLVWRAKEMMKDLRALENHLYRLTKAAEQQGTALSSATGAN